MDGLYDTDALTWAERQADLLSRLAQGERVNADVDWPNVIEEVRDVGLSELRSCRSLLEQAMRHLIKLHCEPNSGSVQHWRAETRVFLSDARRRYAPSMKQRLDLEELYASAVRLNATIAQDFGRALPGLPPTCPFSANDLLAEQPDLDQILSSMQTRSEEL